MFTLWKIYLGRVKCCNYMLTRGASCNLASKMLGVLEDSTAAAVLLILIKTYEKERDLRSRQIRAVSDRLKQKRCGMFAQEDLYQNNSHSCKKKYDCGRVRLLQSRLESEVALIT